MTTAYTTLIDRVRAELGDYGDAVTLLNGAISSASTLSIVVDDATNISAGNFIHVENEAMMVLACNKVTNTLTVIRGAQGTTADTSIADNAPVFVNLDYTNVQIHNALNTALSSAYPKLYVTVTDETLAILADTYEYTIPTGSLMDHLCRVEIENGDLTSQFTPDRYWDMRGSSTIRLYGDRVTGRNIRLVGRKRFTGGVITGNLDASFPDSNDMALSYLVNHACSTLLRSTQGRVGQLDTFTGITDRFSSGQPYVPINTSRQYAEAAAMMLKACAMEPLVEYLPHPTRRFYAKH